MRDMQDAHVSAAARATLFHHIGCGIKGVDKADRAGCDAAGGAHNVALGPQSGKGESGSTAAFVDERSLLDLCEYGVQ